MVIISQMTDDDLAQAVAIEKLSFNAPKDEAVFRHDENKYLVAKNDTQVLGYIGTERIAGETHIINMAVHPDHRNKGIGKQLLGKALRDDEVAFLEVRVSNLAAQKIYEHFGFKNIGLRKKYYQDNDEDAFIMKREAIKHNV
jgi:ribosomal-protein-alanine N-acetyltransferase